MGKKGTELPRLVVVGAAGEVGYGVVHAALARGWRVVAVARDQHALDMLVEEFSGSMLQTVRGSVETAADAQELVQLVALDGSTSVVVATSVKWTVAPLASATADATLAYVANYLRPHLVSANAFLPRMREHTCYLGFGGGMADFVAPGMAAVSMAQAAARMFYRSLARERGERGPLVRQMLIAAKVNGRSNRDKAAANWLTDVEIGNRACDLVGDPGMTVVHTLTGRDSATQA